MYIPFFPFSFSKVKYEKRKTYSFFIFRFCIKDASVALPVRVAKIRPDIIGSFGAIFRSHWQRFENKFADIAPVKWYI